jgi:LPXTG-motif cell wall-anchored protein
MKKIIGIALIVLAVYLGYSGITMFSDSTASVDVLGIELKAEDNQQKTTSFLYLGFALLSAIGGIVLLKSKN